ncbi:DUF485 domain-containing protein [Propionivibrio sp.]|uniref:DUF485 domain-containing protein n=1 Tax=Propionivibrio sp. TaxID=2212460 RepID=UPI003BF2841C
MSSEMYERMRVNPKFQELVKKRGRFAWALAIIVFTMFFGFVLMVAFDPVALGQPVSEVSLVSVGVVIELFLFFFFWVIAAFYVSIANSEFDALTEEIIQQALKEKR